MAPRPTPSELTAWAGEATHAPIFRHVLLDAMTPVSVLARLARQGTPAFLLESVTGGETLGRYSFVGTDPRATIRVRPDHVDIDGQTHPIHGPGDLSRVLRDVLGCYRVRPSPDLPRFQGGLVGYFGYGTVRHFHDLRLPPAAADAPPDASLFLVERLIIIDHVRHRLTLSALVDLSNVDESHREATNWIEQTLDLLRVSGGLAPLDAPDPAAPTDHPVEAVDRPFFAAAVSEAKARIAEGEIFQVVLSQRFRTRYTAPPLDAYRMFRALNPSPYHFFLSFGEKRDLHIAGASPEALVRVTGSSLFTRPIAGTRPRGATPAADDALAQELLADPKELAEHRMLLDLGRNDLGRVAKVGSVRCERPMRIERFSHVMHIVSDVRAELALERDALDALAACFPAGTVSGAPKLRAMEIIAALEPEPRGVYAGAVGYIDFLGNLDVCIAIRTIVMQGDQAEVQAGAGIVFDSIAEREQAECENKASAGLRALHAAEEQWNARPDHR